LPAKNFGGGRRRPGRVTRKSKRCGHLSRPVRNRDDPGGEWNVLEALPPHSSKDSGLARAAPFGEFPVHRGHHRRLGSGQLGKTVPIARKQILDAGSFGDLGTLLRSANDVFFAGPKIDPHVQVYFLAAQRGKCPRVGCAAMGQSPPLRDLATSLAASQSGNCFPVADHTPDMCRTRITHLRVTRYAVTCGLHGSMPRKFLTDHCAGET
jgi:hypothetical protein